jgi:hypothetical protein
VSEAISKIDTYTVVSVRLQPQLANQTNPIKSNLRLLCLLLDLPKTI